MRNSTREPKPLFPVAVRTALLAATTSIAAASPASQADLDILTLTGQLLPNSTDTLLGLVELSAAQDGSWVSTALVSPVVGPSEIVLVGDPSSDGSVGATVLRRAMNIGGQIQARLGRPNILDGEVAYVASSDAAMIVSYESAWLDDQLLALEGAPVGTSGRTWAKLSSVTLRPGGKVFVRGGTSSGLSLIHI